MSDEPDDARDVMIRDWVAGHRAALDALVPILYSELRVLAHAYLRREREDHTLQTTALVHEAYLRLVGQRQVPWDSRAQFLFLSAQMMRRILVNHAVAHRTEKRGGAAITLSVDDVSEVGAAPDHDVMALHEALEKLALVDQRQAQIVELRYFCGLGVEETARVVGISRATVHREWSTARHWLYRALSDRARHD